MRNQGKKGATDHDNDTFCAADSAADSPSVQEQKPLGWLKPS